MTKKCKCNVISFGHINLYILLILLGALFKAVKEILTTISKKLRQSEAGEPEKQHPVIITINYAMGLCLSFILLIIYKLYNKRHKKPNIFLLDKMKNSQNKKISIKEQFLWILFVSPIDFFANLIYCYNWIKDDDYICYWSTNLLLMALFSYLILKMKLYKHHYLSIITINIFGLAYNLINGNLFPNKIKKNYIANIINFFAESTFNILYVLYKFFIYKKFIKTYAILSFQGLIELIIGIIFLVITTKYYPKLDDFNSYISDIDGPEIAIFCSLIIVNFLTFLILFIVLDIFTPFHIFLLNILSEIFFFLFNFFFNGVFKSESESEIHIMITYCIFIIICIIFVLVFIEIIQLNFCSLSTMTKKNIEERARLDSMLNDDNDDENNNNIDKEKINLGEYIFELEEFDNIKSNQILPIN